MLVLVERWTAAVAEEQEEEEVVIKRRWPLERPARQRCRTSLLVRDAISKRKNVVAVIAAATEKMVSIELTCFCVFELHFFSITPFDEVFDVVLKCCTNLYFSFYNHIYSYPNQ